MTYIPLGLKQVASIFLLLGMGEAGPTPGGGGQIAPLWQAGPNGVRTKIVVTKWNNHNET